MIKQRTREILFKANLIIVLDDSNNFKIIKNRSGDLDHLGKDEAIDLITQIMFDTFRISKDNDGLKLFVESIKKELMESYKNIFKKYKIKNFKKSKTNKEIFIKSW